MGWKVEALLSHLGFAHFKHLVALEDDGIRRTTGADEAHSLRVGREFARALSGHGIGRVEDGATGQRAEHGDVLQRHLRGSVLTDRDTGMRADKLDVGGRNGSHTKLIEAAGEKAGKGAEEGNETVTSGQA